MNTRLGIILIFIILFIAGCGGRSDDLAKASVTVEYTLQTGMVEGRMAFIGQGGDIDGIVNPDVVVDAGATARITVVNGDGIPHDLVLPGLGIKSATLSGKGASTDVFVTADEGSYVYYCSVSGHRQAGMEGRLIVRPVEG